MKHFCTLSFLMLSTLSFASEAPNEACETQKYLASLSDLQLLQWDGKGTGPAYAEYGGCVVVRSYGSGNALYTLNTFSNGALLYRSRDYNWGREYDAARSEAYIQAAKHLRKALAACGCTRL